MFAETTFTKNIDLRFDVLPSSEADTTSSHHITETNRYDVHKIEVSNIISFISPHEDMHAIWLEYAC